MMESTTQTFASSSSSSPGVILHHDDAKPSSSSSSSSSSLTLEEQVHQAMSQQLDAQLTKHYYTALRAIPAIVGQETKVAHFLAADQNNPTAAAARLARYWSARLELFGKDRWLLPMTQTGHGALKPEDIRILRSGYIKWVLSHVHGHVLILDFTLLPAGAAYMQPQMSFYLATICPFPVTGLFVVRSGERPPIVFDSEMRRLILSSTAMRPVQIVVAQAYEPGREHLLEFLAQQQCLVTKANYQHDVNAVVKGHSAMQTLHALQDKGFDRLCLPVELGGHVNASTFSDWIRMRLSMEDAMGAAPIGRRHAPACLQLTSTAAATGFTLPSSAAPETQLTQKKNTRLRKRALKGTQRQKERVDLVRHENESEADFAKRKNALYVRRHYHRQKNELVEARAAVAKSRQVNEWLQRENKRLELLWSQAKQLVQQESST